LVPALLLSMVLALASGVAAALEVGDKAPGFDLASTKGGKLASAGLEGKKNLVVQFYVLDFTPT
jgi:peroxiredoxin